MTTAKRFLALLLLLASPLLADEKTIEELPARSPSALEASDLIWGKKSPYGANDDFKFTADSFTLALMGDVDYSGGNPAADDVLVYDGSGWVPQSLPAATLDGDYGDWTCAAGSCTLDADVVAPAEIADADFGDWSCATGVCTLDADVVAPAEIADADFGDFTCATGACTLDADVVAAAEMADADHGDLTWSGGVATLDDSISGDVTFSGTITATTAVVGPNVTSGADPGHTHTGGAVSTDIISEGNSNVEVIDAGTGQVDIDIDGARHWQFLAGSLYAENAAGPGLLDDAASETLATVIPRRTATTDGLGHDTVGPVIIEGGAAVARFSQPVGLVLYDGTSLNLREFAANGTNTLTLTPPGAITSTQTCTLADDARFIPESCVGTPVDVTCTDCLNATEIEDIYLLNSGDTSTGALTFSDGVGDSPAAVFTPQTGDAFSLFARDTDDALVASTSAAIGTFEIRGDDAQLRLHSTSGAAFHCITFVAGGGFFEDADCDGTQDAGDDDLTVDDDDPESIDLETASMLTNIADDEVLVGTGAGTGAYKAVPDCDDGAGNLNYDTATNAFSCGVEAGGGGFPREFSWPATALLQLEHAANSFADPTSHAGTNIDLITYAFDAATDECVGQTLVVPDDLDTAGTIKFRAKWFSATATSGNIIWDIRHTGGQAEGVTWDTALTTETAAADATQGTVNQYTFTEWTETVSNAAWAAGDVVNFELCRDANNASDTLTGDAYLMAFWIEVPLA